MIWLRIISRSLYLLCLWSCYVHVYIYKKRRQPYCPLDIYKSPECGAAHVFAIFFSAQHHSSHKKDTRSRATSERISSSLAFSQMEFADERRVFAERRSSHLPGCPPVGFKVRPHHVCLPEQLWDTHLSSFANRLHLVLMLLPSSDQWKKTFFFSPLSWVSILSTAFCRTGCWDQLFNCNLSLTKYWP